MKKVANCGSCCGVFLPAFGGQFPEILGVSAGNRKTRFLGSLSADNLHYDGDGGMLWEWSLIGQDLKQLRTDERCKSDHSKSPTS